MHYLFFALKGLMSLAFLGTAAAKLSQQAAVLEPMTGLGYPSYLSYILGVAYLLGVIGIWQNQSAALKQWAFAGFAFAMIGAVSSHIINGDPISAIVGASVFLALVLVVYTLEQNRAS
ncbi:MAG: DoxX family protein [Pseudomonadota bacterium]